MILDPDAVIDADFLIQLWRPREWGSASLSQSSTGHLHSPWFKIPQMRSRVESIEKVAGSFCYLLDLSRSGAVLSSIENPDRMGVYYRYGTARPQKL